MDTTRENLGKRTAAERRDIMLLLLKDSYACRSLILHIYMRRLTVLCCVAMPHGLMTISKFVEPRNVFEARAEKGWKYLPLGGVLCTLRLNWHKLWDTSMRYH